MIRTDLVLRVEHRGVAIGVNLHVFLLTNASHQMLKVCQQRDMISDNGENLCASVFSRVLTNGMCELLQSDALLLGK